MNTKANNKAEMSRTKIKKQEEMIDILVGEVKRLKTELVNYELIKELINNKSGNFLTEREKKEMLKRQGVDLGYTCDGSCKTETNQEVKEEAIETKKISQCWVCNLKTHKLFERNRGKSSSYLCCVDCYKDIEEDIKRIQDGEQNSIKTSIKNNQKRKRKGISKQEAMKHSKPSKKKNKVVCKDCGGEYLATNFHSHYAKHIK